MSRRGSLHRFPPRPPADEREDGGEPMPDRYVEPHRPPLAPIGVALRESLRGYRSADLKADLLAGVAVGIVALPLAMALAIASGVPPQHGLYTSIVAGALIAVCGGSRVNVSGPTAAFVVLLAPVSARFGVGGLLIATVIAGAILLALGLLRLGSLIQYIPHPVTTGFTAGIGVVIAALQLKDFFGLRPAENPEHFPEKVASLVRAAGTARWQELAVGAFTLAVLVSWPKISKRLPAPLVGIAAGAGLAWLLSRLVPGFSVDTIGTRFTYLEDGIAHAGIPRTPPRLVWPWDQPGPDGAPVGISLELLRALSLPAFAIATLGAIESLLCAVVADGMAGTRHDPNAELVAQGLGNLAAPFFGGIAATGAIARTATSIRSGARSPIASLFHALFVLAAVLALAPLLGRLPMASLAALLLVVAWNMSEARHFVHIVRVAPRSDVVVLLVCFALTVAFDMVVSVGVGIVLAALLFMRRMAVMFEARIGLPEARHAADPHLEGVLVYDIGGPLFFGAAEKAAATLARVGPKVRAVILRMEDVPVIDVTGLVALESAIARLHRVGIHVVLSGVQRQPRELLAKSGLVEVPGRLAICTDEEQAIAAIHAASGALRPAG